MMHVQGGEHVLLDWDQVSHIISDDSSFYGNDEEKAELKLITGQLSRQELATLWLHHQGQINNIALQERGEHDISLSLKNPYQGVSSARQLQESVDDFLRRVPVLNNPFSAWLRIANFNAGGQIFDEESENPEPDFFSKGLKLLNAYSDKKMHLESRHSPLTAARREKRLATERIQLKSDILRIATECRLVGGKWLLFPLEKDSPAVWEKVCYGVADGHLGLGAKIAAKPDGGPERVICIYTRNFNDREDVKRVVQGLHKLNLLPKDEKRSIYYKCDAYTHLNIKHGNEYGLSASLYASMDFLPKPEKKPGANMFTAFNRDFVEKG